MEIDRRLFIASLGGVSAAATMGHEARAEALEHYMSDLLDADDEKPKFPTAAEVEAQVDTRAYRRGAGGLFVATSGNVSRLAPMPAKPTLMDFFNLRFTTVRHVLQSAT